MKVREILFANAERENREVWNELCTKLQTELWMLCLGAGISISAGLPDWHKLLAKIIGHILSMEIPEEYRNEKLIFKKIGDALAGGYKEIFSGMNVLEVAEYARNYVYEDLDENSDRVNWFMNFFIQEACWTDVELNKENTEIINSTLGAVARLMKSDRDALIHNAITYNYDNLLETYLRNICACRRDQVHSITKEDAIRDFEIKDWNIYHVHGRIPVIEHPDETMSKSVILTESDYYKEEQVNYSWTNTIQSYAIVRANLIFIGFSGADYNFRRIIKYVGQDDIKPRERYIFFSVDDIVWAVFQKELEGKKDKKAYLDECIRQMNEPGNEKYSFEKLYINYMVRAQTQYWKNHGLKVIWSSHEELPDDLDRLHL